jgi:hypothetical protein
LFRIFVAYLMGGKCESLVEMNQENKIGEEKSRKSHLISSGGCGRSFALITPPCCSESAARDNNIP